MHRSSINHGLIINVQEFFNERKEAKMQSSVHSVSNIRCKAIEDISGSKEGISES